MATYCSIFAWEIHAQRNLADYSSRVPKSQTRLSDEAAAAALIKYFVEISFFYEISLDQPSPANSPFWMLASRR